MRSIQANFECSYEFLFKSGFTQEYQCSIISPEICTADINFINFTLYYFCSMNSNIYLFSTLMLIISLLIFRYIAVVVEICIAEGITKIANRLKMSEVFAAATL